MTRRWTQFLCILFLTSLVAVSATAQKGQCSPERDARIAEIRKQVPVDYVGLMAFNGWDRRAAFSMMRAEHKAAVWRENLLNFEDQKTDALTDGQKEVLAQARDLLATKNFRGSSPLMDLKVAELVDLAHEHFSEEEVASLFFQLGPLNERAAEKLNYCTCDYDYDCRTQFNPAGGNCTKFTFACSPSPAGCGPLWTTPCSGICEN